VYRKRNPPSPEETKEKPFFSSQREHRLPGSRGGFFQPKLEVNAPGDKHEQEADAVARYVVNDPEKEKKVQRREITGIQRLATPEEDEKLGTNDARMRRDKEIQRKRIDEPKIQRSIFGGDEEEKKDDEPSLFDRVSGAVTGTVDGVLDTGAQIADTVGNKVGDVKDEVTGAVNGVVSDAAGAASQAVASVGDAPSKVLDTAGGVLDSASQALGQAENAFVPDWHSIQVDWNSPSGNIVRSWANSLDPGIAAAVKGKDPSALFSVVNVPDFISAAANDLSLRARFEPSPGLIPGLKPGVNPGVRPTVPGAPVLPPPILIAIIIFFAILLTPRNIFDKNTEDEDVRKALAEKRKQQRENKKKREEEQGRCRQTIPAERQQLLQNMIRALPNNARIFADQKLGDTPRTERDLGTFFEDNKSLFNLKIRLETKNTILKVCSVSNNTLARSEGDKFIGTTFHAEEIAAPSLIAQLRTVLIEERTGATLFNICQSPACVNPNARNPEGCHGFLEDIQVRHLPGGSIADEPTGFPPKEELKQQTDAALEVELRSRIGTNR